MRFLLSLLFSITSWSVIAQQNMLVDAESIRLKEQEISVLGDSILGAKSDSARILANISFTNQMKNLLQSPNTFTYPFDSLKNVSKQKSEDELIRIYTWILPTDSGMHYQYFGFVQYRNPQMKLFKTFELKDTSADTINVLKKTLKPDNWYGALYYKIIEVKDKNVSYYTLLGWKGNNILSTKKVIDVLYIKNNSLLFGAPVLQFEKKTQSRIIFEFNAQTSMLLHWDEKHNTIVFDNLGPVNEASAKMPETYGATMQYDGLKWKNGQWNFKHDIDIRNEEDSEKAGFTKSKTRQYYTPQK